MQPLEAGKRLEEFSLLGGPLHRLGQRLRLVRGKTDTVPLGLALGGLAWFILVALALIQGIAQQMFSLALIVSHVRLLVVIPLLFVCESWLAPRMTLFADTIVRSGVVPEQAWSAMDDEVARTRRLQESWLAETICLIIALIPLLTPQVDLPGATAILDASRATAAPLAAYWYSFVCLTLFRFLLLRWLWRLGLWWYFLWRLARLDLRLLPAHPDGAAGLGYLEVVHIGFTPLVLALSAFQSAWLAEEISEGVAAFEKIYPVLSFTLILDVMLFIAPLFIFAPKLWTCRAISLSLYGSFAARYVRGFHEKWLGERPSAREPLLGTPDLQSLADLSNSVNIIRNMRWSPASVRLFKVIVIAALLPLLPLVQFRYPIAELLQKFLIRATGL